MSEASEFKEIRAMLAEIDKRVAITNSLLTGYNTRMDSLEKAFYSHEVEIDRRLTPIQKHVDVVSAVLKLMAWALGSGTVGTLLWFIVRR